MPMNRVSLRLHGTRDSFIVSSRFTALLSFFEKRRERERERFRALYLVVVCSEDANERDIFLSFFLYSSFSLMMMVMMIDIFICAYLSDIVYSTDFLYSVQ